MATDMLPSFSPTSSPTSSGLITSPAVDGPIPVSSLPYYTPSQVSQHNLSTDCWVSFFSFVYDLTSIIAAHPASLTAPLLRFAGQDISFFFDAETREPKTCIDPVSGLRVFSTPYGPYPHIPPAFPSSSYRTDFETAWWEDERLRVGRLSSRTLTVRCLNTLTGQEDALQVAAEEKAAELRQRWMRLNGVEDCSSYVFKLLGRVLDLSQTLEENGLKDERDEMDELGINGSEFIPVLHVYYDDQLVE